jgi:N-acetylglutamate synthase-like GNAT family acetyltransferase
VWPVGVFVKRMVPASYGDPVDSTAIGEPAECCVGNIKEISMIDSYIISTDKSRLNIPAIHDYLSHRSYWGKGRTIEAVRKSIDNSLCFGIYDKSNQMAGFARVITDFTIFAYLLDLFIFEEHRKRGLGKFLVQHIVNDAALQDVSFWLLGTKDAHGLYKQYGFNNLSYPERIMEKRKVANMTVNSDG